MDADDRHGHPGRRPGHQLPRHGLRPAHGRHLPARVEQRVPRRAHRRQRVQHGPARRRAGGHRHQPAERLLRRPPERRVRAVERPPVRRHRADVVAGDQGRAARRHARDDRLGHVRAGAQCWRLRLRVRPRDRHARDQRLLPAQGADLSRGREPELALRPGLPGPGQLRAVAARQRHDQLRLGRLDRLQPDAGGAGVGRLPRVRLRQGADPVRQRLRHPDRPDLPVRLRPLPHRPRRAGQRHRDRHDDAAGRLPGPRHHRAGRRARERQRVGDRAVERRVVPDPVTIRALTTLLALVAAIPAQAELRGTWVARDGLVSRQKIQSTLDQLAAANCNCVCVNVWSRGFTIHPSDVLFAATGQRQDPSFVGRDPLQEFLIEAHRRGIEVEAWFEYGFMFGWSGWYAGPTGVGPV
ncbi:MAG: hypothetical protein FJ265_23015, partial [Planctomycetes bacterium]|nr:hypothetical protein [Planctomycetota bacterium]